MGGDTTLDEPEERTFDVIAQEHLGSPDFQVQWGLGAVNAHQAYAQLELAGVEDAPGTGVNVWFIDSGLDLRNPALNTDLLEKVYVRASSGPIPDETCQDAPDPQCVPSFSHGTAVASIVGADPDLTAVAFPSAPLRGLAWGANLGMLVIPLGSGSGNPPYVSTAVDRFPSISSNHALIVGCAIQISGCTATEDGKVPDLPPADILNLSFSISGLVAHYSEDELRTGLSEVIQVMAQEDRAETETEKTILVWAAGNHNGRNCVVGDERLGDDCVAPETDQGAPGAGTGAPGTGTPGAGVVAGSLGKVNAVSPSLLAGLMARIEELRGHTIAVVSVRENDPADAAKDGAISSFSNRCGIAADWCIAAPGQGITYANRRASGPGIFRGSGTSYAAPMVAGGLAVMKHLFRDQVPHTGLVARLFATADKEGIYADRDTYGQGLMDLGAATAPVGSMSLAGGATVDGPGTPLGATGIRPGAAFGDGLSRSLAGREAAAFDALGAPFWFRLGDLAASAAPRPARPGGAGPAPPAPSGDPVDGLAMAPGWVSGAGAGRPGAARLRFGVVPSSADAGHAALAGDAVALAFGGGGDVAAAAFTTTGMPDRRPVSGVSLSYRPQGGPIGLRAGWIGEGETLLGTESAGAFGPVSGDSVFAGLRAGFGSPGGWRVAADAEVGVADPRSGGGLVQSLSPLTTSAFAISGGRTLSGGDEMTLRVSQPLRLEDGEGVFTVPVGRTKGGAVLRSRFTGDLAPSGRQVDISARWSRPLAGAGHVALDLTWTRHPGHDADAGPEARVLAAFRTEF